MDFASEAITFITKTLINTTALLIGVIAYLLYRFLKASFESLSWAWVSRHLVRRYRAKMFDRNLTNYDGLFVTLDLMGLQVTHNLAAIHSTKKAERVIELLSLTISFTHDYFMQMLENVVNNIGNYDVDSLSDHLARTFYDYCSKLLEHVTSNFAVRDINRDRYIQEFRVLLEAFSYQIRVHIISLQDRIKNNKINMFQYLMAYQARFASAFRGLFADFAPLYFSKLNGELDGVYSVVSLKLDIVKAFINSGICIDPRTNTLVIYFKGYVQPSTHHKVVLNALDVLAERQLSYLIIDFGNTLDSTSTLEWTSFFEEVVKRKLLSGPAYVIISPISEFFSNVKFGHKVYESSYFAYYEVLNASKRRKQKQRD